MSPPIRLPVPPGAAAPGAEILSDAPPSGLEVRSQAVAVLERIFGHGEFLDVALAKLPPLAEPRDRAFLKLLVMTALRHWGEAAAAVARFLDRPLPRKAGTTNLILNLAVAQLYWLDTPAHAAIDTAVRLAKAHSGARHFVGLVNAVLRRLAEAPRPQPSAILPAWLMARWTADYGAETAAAIAAASLGEAATDLTVRSDPAFWATRLGGMLLPTGSIRLAAGSGAVDALPGYGEGAWWVQDAAAALPARLLGDVAGLDVIDLCAAPGGKTLQLAAAGARVTAVDSSEARLERLRDNLRRTGLLAKIVAADALAYDPGRAVDAVLLDAPCSGTGTIRRHPELPWIRTEEQFAALPAIQRDMIERAVRFLKPGGRIVYCVCSIERAEGEAQIDAFLARNGDFAIMPVEPGEAGIPAHMVDGRGRLRTLPRMALGESSGLDGFFAACLVRRA